MAVSFICTLQVKYGFHSIGYCETLTYLTTLHGEICYTESRQFRSPNVEITGRSFFTIHLNMTITGRTFMKLKLFRQLFVQNCCTEILARSSGLANDS
jgi:hypothetical protein